MTAVDNSVNLEERCLTLLQIKDNDGLFRVSTLWHHEMGEGSASKTPEKKKSLLKVTDNARLAKLLELHRGIDCLIIQDSTDSVAGADINMWILSIPLYRGRDIADFLLHVFKTGAQACTVQGYRSAISAVHHGLPDCALVSHNAIRMFDYLE